METETEERTEPARRRRLWTAGGIALAGFVVAAVIAAATMFTAVGQLTDLPRADIPGELTVTIDEPGGQVIYLERDTWRTDPPDGTPLEIEVTGPDGAVVETDSYDLPVQYRWLGTTGHAHETFTATQAGQHHIEIAGDVEGDVTAAVGPSFASTVLTGVVVAVVVVLAAIAMALVITVRTLNRDNARGATVSG